MRKFRIPVAIIIVLGMVILFNGGIDGTLKKLGYEKVGDEIQKDSHAWEEVEIDTRYKIVGGSILLEISLCEKQEGWFKSVMDAKYYADVTYFLHDRNSFDLGDFGVGYKEFRHSYENCYTYSGTKRLPFSDPKLIEAITRVSGIPTF